MQELTDDKKVNIQGIGNLRQPLKMWRRKLGIQLPDPLILSSVLTKWAEQLGKLGGVQAAYRIATIRQPLDVDGRPTHGQIVEFAEVLQAEAEQLMASLDSSVNTKKAKQAKEAVKAAALNAGTPGMAQGPFVKRKAMHLGHFTVISLVILPRISKASPFLTGSVWPLPVTTSKRLVASPAARSCREQSRPSQLHHTERYERKLNGRAKQPIDIHPQKPFEHWA